MSATQVSGHAVAKSDRPTCANCGTLMWLARIAPDKPGFDSRTFECPVCNESQTLVVRYDKTDL
jgi:hypothetical protein